MQLPPVLVDGLRLRVSALYLGILISIEGKGCSDQRVILDIFTKELREWFSVGTVVQKPLILNEFIGRSNSRIQKTQDRTSGGAAHVCGTHDTSPCKITPTRLASLGDA